LDRKWVVALFARFRAIYLQKWDDQFDCESTMEQAMDEWGVGLVGLSAEQIRHGIDAARTKSMWPPSIAEFVAYARSHDRPVFFVALPKPQASASVVRAELSAMRDVLRGVAAGV